MNNDFNECIGANGFLGMSDVITIADWIRLRVTFDAAPFLRCLIASRLVVFAGQFLDQPCRPIVPDAFAFLASTDRPSASAPVMSLKYLKQEPCKENNTSAEEAIA